MSPELWVLGFCLLLALAAFALRLRRKSPQPRRSDPVSEMERLKADLRRELNEIPDEEYLAKVRLRRQITAIDDTISKWRRI